jgi:hypothetical protein
MLFHEMPIPDSQSAKRETTLRNGYRRFKLPGEIGAACLGLWSALLDRLFGFRGHGMRGLGRLVDVIGHALHAFLEATKPFAEPFAQLRQLLAAKQNQKDNRDQDQVRWLK